MRTGVHEIAILRDILGHLSAFWALFGGFRGEVSTFFAPKADFMDTCHKMKRSRQVTALKMGLGSSFLERVVIPYANSPSTNPIANVGIISEYARLELITSLA